MIENSFKGMFVGDIVTSKCGNTATVVEFNGQYATLMFENGEVIKRRKYDVYNKEFRGNYQPVAYGVGCTGNPTIHTKRDMKQWRDILLRCCVKPIGSLMSYKTTTIDDSWLVFEHFMGWLSNRKAYNLQTFVIDKDILGKNNYGSDSCCLVPTEINGFFIRSDGDRGVVKPKDENYFVARTIREGRHYRIGTSTTKEGATLLWRKEKAKILRCLIGKYKNNLDDYVVEALYGRANMFDSIVTELDSYQGDL